MNNCVKKNGKPHSELVCTDEPGLALLKSKTVPIVDRDIALNIIGTDRTKLAEISIDTSKLNNPTILVMFSGLYVPFAAIHLGARITLYKQTGIKNNKKCCSQRDDNGDRGDVLLSHPLRAIQINLSEDDLQELENVNKNLYEINKSYNIIVKDLKTKKEPYSSLKEKIESLSNKLATTENDLDICLKSLGSMQEDEQRAREQLKEITALLSKCKTSIRNYPLPIITSNYFVELSEANDAILEIIKELDKTPITIKTLNIRVDTARDLSLKLFNTTTEMIKTAKLAEMIIVYGNRYKPLDKDIERGLDIASKLFFEGSYKLSLETSIAAIKIVEPDIYNKMLNLYKN